METKQQDTNTIIDTPNTEKVKKQTKKKQCK